VALLFEPVADDHSARREPTFESVSGPTHAGLVAADLPVETVHHGRNAGFPPLFGLDLPLCPDPHLISDGVMVSLASGMVGGLLSLLAGAVGLGEISDALTCFAGLRCSTAGGGHRGFDKCLRPGFPQTKPHHRQWR
jgi:hypothetical protein